MLKAVHVQESKKAAREKTKAVIAGLNRPIDRGINFDRLPAGIPERSIVPGFLFIMFCSLRKQICGSFIRFPDKYTVS